MAFCQSVFCVLINHPQKTKKKKEKGKTLLTQLLANEIPKLFSHQTLTNRSTTPVVRGVQSLGSRNPVSVRL